MAESFSRLQWTQDNVAALGVLIALVALLLTVLGAVGGGAWRLATTLTALDENIGELTTTVGELETTVDTLSSDVGGLKTAVDTLSSDVGELRTAVGTLSSDVSEPDENVGGVAANVLTEFTQATRCLAALSTSPEWEVNIAAGLGAPAAPPTPPRQNQPRRAMPEECRALQQEP